MRRYNGVTEWVNCNYDAVSLAVPVFTVFADAASRAADFAFAEVNHINVSKLQISPDSLNAHRGGVDFAKILQQNFGIPANVVRFHKIVC